MKYDIIINDTIGWPISARYVRRQMEGLEGRDISVFISSLGGSVGDALEIRQMFLDHGRVTAYVYGMTASAATIIAAGAQKVVVGDDALMLIHNASQYVDAWGSMNAKKVKELASDLESLGNSLDTIDGVIAGIYAKRCKKSVDELLAIMEKAEWLNAATCVEYGLADEVDGLSPSEQAPSASPLGENASVDDGRDLLRARVAAYGLPALEPGGNAPGTVADNGQQTTDNGQPKNKETMKKKIFALLGVVLALADNELEFVDGVAMVTEDQADALEKNLQEKVNRIADLEGQVMAGTDASKEKDGRISDLEAEIASLKGEIADLKKGDGAETPGMTEDEEHDAAMTGMEAYNALKGIL